MNARHRNQGLRKRCDCGRRDWPKCEHPWHLNFQWAGRHYRLSLDREAGRRLLGKTEAKTVADQVRAAIREGTYSPPRKQVPEQAPQLRTPTLTQFGEVFLERYSKARGKKSWEDDAYMLRVVGAFNGLGKKPLDAITTDDLEAFFEHLKAGGRAGSTFNHYRQLVRLMFAWAVRKGHLQRNPLANVELPRLPQAKRNRRVSDDEEASLLRAANPPIARLVIAALETGCRQGELLALQWKDVDVERREFRVLAENAKDAEDRTLPISSRLGAVLEMARLDPAGQPFPSDAHVFGNAMGHRIRQIKRAWQVAVLKAYGYTPVWKKGRLTDECRQRLSEIDLHFHDLRHEAGSRWADGGMPLHHIKALLGHANIKTTDTYLNATRIGLQESMRKYEEFRKTCTPVAQTRGKLDDVEESSDPVTESEVEVPPGLMGGGVCGTIFATGARPWPHEPLLHQTTNLSGSMGYEARLGLVCDFRCLLKNETTRRRASLTPGDHDEQRR